MVQGVLEVTDRGAALISVRDNTVSGLISSGTGLVNTRIISAGGKAIIAAGDVTDVTEKQISVAVGEGSKASLEIISYLQSIPYVE